MAKANGVNLELVSLAGFSNSVDAAIKSTYGAHQVVTLPRPAELVHASHTRLIVYKCLVQFSPGIALHHQSSEIRIAGNVYDAAGGVSLGRQIVR